MTHVVVDGELLDHPGGAGRGLGRYVDALITSLPGAGIQVSVLLQGDHQVPDAVHRVQSRRSGRTDRWGWIEQLVRSGVDARRARADLLHTPGLDPPLWFPGPKVHTLHDIIPLVFPGQWGSEPRRWRVRGALMRRADAVIAISQHTADLAMTHLGISARRLHVIHHGVTPVFSGPAPLGDGPPEDPYILYVGAFGPHKGFDEAFEVAARVADAGLPHRLRLVGGFDSTTAPLLEAKIGRARRPEVIEPLGQVSDDALVGLYRGASALVVTSRYEGFGRPTIEALAVGTPVVSFDNSSLGEVLGDGGILVPDGDVGRFAAELVALLQDPGAGADLRTRALERARHFSWQRCAEEHAIVYREVTA